MKSILKLIATVFVLVQAQYAHASFSVSPMETAIAATVGGQTTNTISVTNGQDKPVHITASTEDWTLKQNGEFEYAEAGTMPDSCASWIQLNPANFVLAPKQTVMVRYSITTPANFDREKRAMIFFKSRPIPTKNEGGGFAINISMRIGCKIFISPANTAPVEVQGKITDMNVSPMGDKVQVSMANTGLKSLRVKGNIEARDNNGVVIAKGRLLPENAQILPGLARDLWASWDKKLPSGTYTFNATLDYGAKSLLGGQMKAEIANAPTATP